MTKLRLLTTTLILLLCVACTPTGDPPREVITPFPTQTPGRVIQGNLPAAVPLGGEQSNPATAVALNRQPTATPNLSSCPVIVDGVTMEDTPPLEESIAAEEIVRFLRDGGEMSLLEITLRETWDIIGDDGFFRANVDFTGEGRAEVMAGYTLPDGNGALLVAGCVEGTYVPLVQDEAAAPLPPTLITFGDVNRDNRNDLVYAMPQCDLDDDTGAYDLESCVFRVRMLTWLPNDGRFGNLLNADLITTTPPTLSDIDNDQVSELLVRLDDTGDGETGPLRTGTTIYDWDGISYVLSIRQLDPPRFKIQVIHEADRALLRGEYELAIELYTVSLDDDLRFWFDDEPDLLRSYTFYRLLTTQARISSAGLNGTINQINVTYPDPANRPLYADLAQAFLADFQLSGSVASACAVVRDQIDAQPQAVELLNRYGDRSPTYTEQDLCPF